MTCLYFKCSERKVQTMKGIKYTCFVEWIYLAKCACAFNQRNISTLSDNYHKSNIKNRRFIKNIGE